MAHSVVRIAGKYIRITAGVCLIALGSIVPFGSLLWVLGAGVLAEDFPAARRFEEKTLGWLEFRFPRFHCISLRMRDYRNRILRTGNQPPPKAS